MTEKLKTLMDDAAEVDFATPDLDAIYRDGDKAVRRRGLTVAAAGLAAAAFVVGAVAVTTGDDGPENAIAGDPAPLTEITWAWDGALHTPDGGVYDVGRPIKAYVRTSVGYAFLDDKDVVYSFVDGVVEEVGTVGHPWPQLYADDEGSLVGWVVGTGDERRFVVHDLADGTTERFGDPTGMEERSEFDPFAMYAIDGRTAYVHDNRGAIAVDVDSGDVRVIEAQPGDGFDIKGVEDGLIAFAASWDSAGVDAGQTIVGSSPDDGVELVPGWGSPAFFSPDGRFVSLEGDHPEVYDTATGQRIKIDLDGRPFGTGFDWLDDDTLVVGAAPKLVGPLEILTCEVPSGTCTVLAPDLGMFEDLEGKLAIPSGMTAG